MGDRGLTVQVSDLLAYPGQSRRLSEELALKARVGESAVDGDALVEAALESIPEGVVATVRASVIAGHECVRCLTRWEAPVEITVRELFARRPVDDQFPISRDGLIDLEPLVRDELVLALPPDPICRPDCAGLCPTCGADLNTNPCGGHGADAPSPFAALADLFDSDT
jgi:uncharacterized protein